MSDGSHDQPRRTRLGALKALGLAVAGVAGGSVLGRERTASAADGSNLVLGNGTSNSASTQTTLVVGSTPVSAPATTSGLLVQAPDQYAAIEGDSSSVGVLGNATTGVMGRGAVGGVFAGDLNAIQLNPQTFAGDSIPSTDTHLQGDILVDVNGVLWLCVSGGTPGTWIKVSHGGVRPLSVPQRAYDSRQTGGKFSNNEERDITIAGSVSGVPSNAVGAVGNLTITNTVGGGFVKLWPTGQTEPSTSAINWSTDNMTIANGFNVAVGALGRIAIRTVGTLSQTTDVIVDITGYIL